MTDTTEAQLASLNVREKIAHIDQMLADIDRIFADRDRKRQEIRYAPMLAVLTGMGSAAAFFGAGVAFVKIFGP